MTDFFIYLLIFIRFLLFYLFVEYSLKPWNFKQKMVHYPLVSKNNTPGYPPHSVALDYGSLVCRFKLSTAGTIFQILCILAHTFYTCISSYKFCLLQLFFYCEYMVQIIIYAFCVNRLFTQMQINFIALAHNNYHFFIF